MAGSKLARCLAGISCAVGIVSVANIVFSQRADQPAPPPEPQWAVVQTYCVSCHNTVVRAGDIMFDQLTAESVPQNAEIFEAAVRKFRGAPHAAAR